jgi:hypothetical protein
MMDEAALRAELKAQAMRTRNDETDMDRLHQQIQAQEEAIAGLRAAGHAPGSSDPVSLTAPEWLSRITAALDSLQSSVEKLSGSVSPRAASPLPVRPATEDAAIEPAALPAASAARRGRVSRSISPQRLRTHRTTLEAHPTESGAARLIATDEDGQHSAVFVVRPSESRPLLEIRIIAAAAPLAGMRLRLSGDQTDWNLNFPCHLDTGHCGRIRATGDAPAAHLRSRALPGGWCEFILSFPDPVSRTVVAAVILSRDPGKATAHFAGTAQDAIGLHDIVVVQSEEIQEEGTHRVPDASPSSGMASSPPEPQAESGPLDTPLLDESVAGPEAEDPDQQAQAGPASPALPERVLVKGKLLSATKTAELLARRRDLESAYRQSDAAKRLQALRNSWSGKRAFIIGNGPSLKHQDLLPLRDELTFFTNWGFLHPDYQEIRPKFHCSSSHEIFGGWGKADPRLNEDFAAALVSRSAGVRKVFPWRFEGSLRNSALFPEDELYFMLFERPKFLIDEIGQIDLDLNHVMHDGYTGVITFCIPLAVHLGVKEIYLLGCDCDYGIKQADDPKQYFYPTELHKTSTSAFESLDRIWAENGPVFQTYALVERQLRDVGVRLYNATHGGRLDNIPRRRYEDILNDMSPG